MAKGVAGIEAFPEAMGTRENGDKAVLSVSQALMIAKRQLEGIRVSIEGEVSEFSDKPGYKAVYFTLTDKDSALPCMIWKNDFARNDIQLRQGMLVQISGSFSLYAAKGRMNFVARSIKPAGEGDLRMKVAMLAKKLEAEGLMAQSRKRPVPKMAERVAVVTSPRGKAIHDVLRTLRRRAPQVEVYVVGIPVEGESAPNAIVNGLQVADASDCDVILLVRGGGSYEDLMPFNDERVARAVVACSHPVVTGIGHEPDNSIADMVSDLRCSTPTAAAESTTVEVSQLVRTLEQAADRISNALLGRLDSSRKHLAQLASRPVISDPSTLLAPFAVRLDMDAERLSKAIPNAIRTDRQALETASGKLAGLGARLLDRPRQSVAMAAARLDDLSPLSILSRGYAAAYSADGKVVSSTGQVSPGDPITVMVSDGSIECTVEAVAPRSANERQGTRPASR